jgi:hypothetical protein
VGAGPSLQLLCRKWTVGNRRGRAPLGLSRTESDACPRMVEQYVGWPAWGRGKRGLKVIQGESVYCPAAQIKLLLDSPLSSFYFGTQGLVCTPHSLSLLPCPFAGIDPFPKVRCENQRRRLGMKVFPEPLKADWFPSSAGENHGRKPGLGLRLTQPRREGRLQLPLGIGVRSKTHGPQCHLH